jgi:hypothetical protein
MSRFFINRPVTAIVISILITLGGLVVARRLPIAQFPQISPPEIVGMQRRHHPFAAAQDRCADSRDSAQGLGPDEQQLPTTNSLQPGSSATALLNSFRPAATRFLTTPKQISTHPGFVCLS